MMLLVLALVAPIFGAIPEAVSAAPHRTTAALNLRTGPGLNHSVIRVMPAGVTVEVTGNAQSGFLPVTYAGSSGFASADYLTAASSGSNANQSGPTGQRVVIDGRLNLRSGPGTSHSVLLVMPDGASVQLTGEVSNDFSRITYNGTTGWAATRYLGTPGTSGQGSTSAVTIGDTVTGSATTTARLNLRHGPSTGHGVLLTMPNGARVDVMGQAQSGFVPVRYNGTKGWASSDFLTTGAAQQPAEPADPGGSSSVAIGDTVTGSATTTARLNLRRGPGTGYGVLLTMPLGARIDVMGQAQSGFTPVRYNGTKGWASSDFLTTGSSGNTGNPGNGNSGWNGEDMVTTRAVNLRSSATTASSIVWVLPPNTKIDVTGGPQNGFYPANWAHVSGWVHGDYLIPVSQHTDPGPSTARDEQMIAIIYQAADKWGQSRVDMLRVARCESHLDPNIVNPASGTSGLFQFRPSTFAMTPNGQRGENIFDPWTNADAAGWMWANGMRNHWACQ